MKKEICSGVIPVTHVKGDIHVLLVQHRKGSYWGFPKGHLLHPKEDLRIAAMRELREETQLKIVRFLGIEPLQEQYLFYRNEEKIFKTVWYYIAETTESFFIEHEELLDAKWVKLQKLPSYASHKSSNALMVQAQKAIIKFYNEELL